MDIDKRLELIKRNTQEVVSEDELNALLKKKKQPCVYLGTAITGRPHIGYFLWVLKMADFSKAGCKVKVLLADLHGALDGTPWEVLEDRYDYYEAIIKEMFKTVDADMKKIEFVKGSEFQLKPEYFYDALQLATKNSVNDTKRAAAEVVKMGENPKLAGLIYPIMQALDEVYLDADIQYGGIDQRKILMFARENLPKIAYDSRIEIMTPLIPGLIEGGKMSSSVEGGKVDLLDDSKTVEEKVNKAYCLAGDKENGLLPFLKYVIMVIKGDKNEEFIVNRSAKFGGDKKYKNYEDIEKDFVDKKLHPMDLKIAVAREINGLLGQIRKNIKKLQKLSKEAYK